METFSEAGGAFLTREARERRQETSGVVLGDCGLGCVEGLGLGETAVECGALRVRGFFI